MIGEMWFEVLVVRAEYGGTRITAGFARAQNCDVYAAPGKVTDKNSWGRHTRIKQGAMLMATWKTFGKNCRRMCDLSSLRRPALNRQEVKRHHYLAASVTEVRRRLTSRVQPVQP